MIDEKDQKVVAVSNFDWSPIRTVLDDLYPDEQVYEIAKDNSQLYIIIGGFLQGIFQKLSDEDFLTFHVRASLPPDMALKLFALFADKGVVPKLGEVFEVRPDGEFVHGLTALRLVANNIHLVWFNEPHPAVKRAMEHAKKTKERSQDSSVDLVNKKPLLH